jgi:mRNA-degrading endonuclease toxin of MazEF toxin-antitoxin module
MTIVRQGDIYWVRADDLDVAGSEQDKSRPYLIVSRDQVNQERPNVVGVPLTTNLKLACSYRVLIPTPHMMKEAASSRKLEDSVALVDHVRVLDKKRFELPRMGYLSKTAVGGIEGALSFLFDIR